MRLIKFRTAPAQAHDRLFGVALFFALVAGVTGCLGGMRYRQEAAVDEKRRLFEREGQQAPCELLDRAATMSRTVTKTRSGVELARSDWRTSSSTVTCRFMANGVERVDEFDVPFDHEAAVGNASRRPLGVFGASDVGRQLAETRRGTREALMTVTYLPTNPERAILGPPRLSFPQTDRSSTLLSGSLGTLVLALVLAGAGFKVRSRPPRWSEDDGLDDARMSPVDSN